jgi:uncharacterized protein (UPF0332 family)
MQRLMGPPQMSDNTPDVPDEIVGPERTLLQMFKLFVEPEVKRRQLTGSLPDPFTVVKAQVLFFEGRPPEVKLDKEIAFSVRAREPRAFHDDEPISLSEIEQYIDAIELDIGDADAGHFTAILLNDHWLMLFDFQRNKLKGANLVERSEQFCASAEDALARQHFGPAIENLFSACELAAKARLITSAAMNSEVKTHGTIRSGINQWGKLGNVDRAFVEMFNKLSNNRDAARYTTDKHDLSGLISADMIAKARAEIAELKARLKRFGDPS